VLEVAQELGPDVAPRTVEELRPRALRPVDTLEPLDV
jgi:hypothetical protein